MLIGLLAEAATLCCGDQLRSNVRIVSLVPGIIDKMISSDLEKCFTFRPLFE